MLSCFFRICISSFSNFVHLAQNAAGPESLQQILARTSEPTPPKTAYEHEQGSFKNNVSIAPSSIPPALDALLDRAVEAIFKRPVCFESSS